MNCYGCGRKRPLSKFMEVLSWPRGLRSGSRAARLLRLRVRIPPAEWMSVCCECCVLRRADHSSRGVLPSVVCLSVIVKPRWGGPGPLGAVPPREVGRLAILACAWGDPKHMRSRSYRQTVPVLRFQPGTSETPRPASQWPRRLVAVARLSTGPESFLSHYV